MKRKNIILLLILTLSFSIFASGNTTSTKLKSKNSELNNYLLAQNMGDATEDNEKEKTNPRKMKKAKESFRDGKSPLIASGLSLLIPGAGEIYGEDYLRGGIFLGIEVALWSGYYYYDTDGDDKTEAFHKYAGENFSEDRYFLGVTQLFDPAELATAGLGMLDSIGYVSNRSNWEEVANFLEVDSLLYSSEGYTDFGHELPTNKTQQYYEMIGKYHQFAMGWNDFSGWEGGSLTIAARQDYLSFTSSKQEDIYEDMRYQANLAYEAGQNFLMVSVLNHVASAFDAAYVIKSKYRIETKIRIDKKDKGEDLGVNNFKLAYIVNF